MAIIDIFLGNIVLLTCILALIFFFFFIFIFFLMSYVWIFAVYVSLTEKLGCCLELTKCVKNTVRRVTDVFHTFVSVNQLPGFSITGKLGTSGLKKLVQ